MSVLANIMLVDDLGVPVRVDVNLHILSQLEDGVSQITHTEGSTVRAEGFHVIVHLSKIIQAGAGAGAGAEEK